MDDKITQEEITKMTGQDLAAFVVMHRCLGQFQEEAKMSMIELMRRKVAGDQFDFQAFIEENTKKCAINFNIPSFTATKQKLNKTIINTVIDILKDTTMGQENQSQNNIDDEEDDED